jgi:hypothetical protein
MATSNLRKAIERLFAAIAGGAGLRSFRQPRVFAAICAAFGVVLRRALTSPRKLRPGRSLSL